MIGPAYYITEDLPLCGSFENRCFIEECVGILQKIRFNSFNSETKRPMHRECGFIRIKPGTNKVAFISAQNTGIVEIEEGEVKDQELTLASQSVARMSFAKEPHVQQVVTEYVLLDRTVDNLFCHFTGDRD
ncbi:peroxynitrite isomerase THAP4-like [Rhincodon typus]|uniref:peroxynitrite isomerase THAP4-like n=1 Tax=Rhincodon typus TaxID=259920 RepID=UPI00202F305B|nr:peroxynitrite isomerase THAP4-like [Rhincodon typus]